MLRSGVISIGFRFGGGHDGRKPRRFSIESNWIQTRRIHSRGAPLRPCRQACGPAPGFVVCLAASSSAILHAISDELRRCRVVVVLYVHSAWIQASKPCRLRCGRGFDPARVHSSVAPSGERGGARCRCLVQLLVLAGAEPPSTTTKARRPSTRRVDDARHMGTCRMKEIQRKFDQVLHSLGSFILSLSCMFTV